MEPLRFCTVLCLIILTMETVVLKGDELKNGTAQSQGNVTLSTLSNHQGNNNKEHVRGKHNNEVVFNTSKGSWYKRGGGGGFKWGWGGGGGGGGGGSGGGGGGWGWGGGGGGGGWWKWGCRNEPRSHVKGKQGMKKHHHYASKEEYRLGEFAQCMTRTRCKGMRLDCPLHCGGPCFYDCYHMCKAHCRRP